MEALKFFKGTALAAENRAAGVIFFDKTNKLLKVYTGTGENDYEDYTGVTNAVYGADQVLRIFKGTNEVVTLNFKDVASAKQVMSVFSELETSIRNVKTTADKAAGDITAINGQITNIQEDIEDINALLGNTEGSSGLTDRVTALETAVETTLPGQISDLETELRGGYENSMKDLNDAISTVNTKADNNGTAITGLDTRMTAAESKITNYGTRLDAAEGEIGALQTHATDYEARVKALETEVAGTNGMSGVTRIDTLETTVGTHATSIEANEDAIAEIKTAIGFDKETNIDTRVANIETLVGGADGDTVINNLTEVIEWFNGVQEGEAGAQLVTDVATNKSDIADLKADVKTAQDEVDALELLVGTAADAAAADGSIVAQLKKYAQDEADVAETTAKGYADTKVSEAKSEVVGATGDGAKDVNTIVGAIERANAAKQVADNNATAITGINTTLAEVQTTANNAATKTELATEKAALLGESGVAGNTVISAKEDAAAAMAKANTNEGNITTVTGRVSTLETKVNELETKCMVWAAFE